MLLHLWQNLTLAMKRQSSKRKEYEKDLLFYLRYFKKFSIASQNKFQYEIDKLIELLKEMD